ncbi:MAG: hypothetical protein HYU97_00025 [Deltaproteobacteria bacterium]|nr:hypothetical protein [Deltaproteobacteria bacterium]
MAGIGKAEGKGTAETVRPVETEAERIEREKAGRRAEAGAVIPEGRPETPVNARETGAVFGRADVERMLTELREKGGKKHYTGALEFARIKEGPEVLKEYTITRPTWWVRAVEWFKGIFPGFRH